MLEKIDELLEAVTVAEAASLTELKAFGCIAYESGLSDAELNEETGTFWEFACDLYDEPRGYVSLDLY